ncbi:hypothetical protein HKD37_13G035777 [Glycine soja]
MEHLTVLINNSTASLNCKEVYPSNESWMNEMDESIHTIKEKIAKMCNALILPTNKHNTALAWSNH